MFVFLFCVFWSICIVLCDVPHFVYCCLYTIQVYWPLPPVGNQFAVNKCIISHHIMYHIYIYIYIYIYIGFKTFFYVVRHLDSTASYLPTGLHLGFFCSWSSLYLSSSFFSVFLVFSFVSASTSMLCKLVLSSFFYNCFL